MNFTPLNELLELYPIQPKSDVSQLREIRREVVDRWERMGLLTPAAVMPTNNSPVHLSIANGIDVWHFTLPPSCILIETTSFNGGMQRNTAMQLKFPQDDHIRSLIDRIMSLQRQMAENPRMVSYDWLQITILSELFGNSLLTASDCFVNSISFTEDDVTLDITPTRILYGE